MLNSQKLTLELSVARSRLNRAIAKRNELPASESPGEELVKEIDAATRDIEPLEVEFRAAIVMEQEEDEKEKRLNKASGHASLRSRRAARQIFYRSFPHGSGRREIS